MKTFSDKVGLIGLIITFLALVAAIATEEIRVYLGLEERPKLEKVIIKSSQDVPNQTRSYLSNGKLRFDGIYVGWSDRNRRNIYFMLLANKTVRAYYGYSEEYISSKKVKSILMEGQGNFSLGEYTYDIETDKLNIEIISEEGSEVFKGKVFNNGLSIDIERTEIKSARTEWMRFSFAR